MGKEKFFFFYFFFLIIWYEGGGGGGGDGDRTNIFVMHKYKISHNPKS